MEIFGTHMSAAQQGCPTCKGVLNDLEAQKRPEGSWVIRCTKSGCKGFIEYYIKYELDLNKGLRKKIINAQAPTPQQPVIPPQVTSDTWEYLSDEGWWMSPENKPQKLEDLSDAAFSGAIKSLVEFNFQRVGCTISWTKQIPDSNLRFPKDKCSVGAPVAKQKLTELFEVAVSKGLVHED